MFTSVQNISQNTQNPRKTMVFDSGMTLAKHNTMKLQITYREITMIFGTLIAIVVMFTLWVRKPEMPDSSIQLPLKVTAVVLPTAKTIVESAADVLFQKTSY
jgi:NADH:ubiquinone oxidoreductase subunit 3 (subunit A)